MRVFANFYNSFSCRAIRLWRSKKPIVCTAFVLALSFALFAHLMPTRASASNAAAAESRMALARMSEEVSIRAAGHGTPFINLSDGHELFTGYNGPQELAAALESKRAEGRSLASADFDEDGVPDLISGYRAASGGIVTLLRGNVDAIYPNTSEAKQRKAEGAFTDAPFLSPAVVFSVPEAVDFVGAGDFDGDSHWDVVAARRDGSRLYLLSGDGRGGLKQAKEVELPGKVTALIVGEVNRRDGLDDVLVGVNDESGAKVLVYEGPEGALRAKPEVFSAPDEVTSLALGQLDDSYEMDLAVAAGSELMILHGRDRKLSLEQLRQAEVKPAKISRRSFPFEIRSIATGDFNGGNTTDMALLTSDGSIFLLSQSDLEAQSASDHQKPGKELEQWQSKLLSQTSSSGQSKLVGARVTSAPVDNLVLVDPGSNEVEIIADAGAVRSSSRNSVAEQSNKGIEAKLKTDGAPVAVLAMRLNTDALSDLVMLRSNPNRVMVAMTLAQATFTVRNTNDSGAGSLRQAILDANANPGADMISFNIPSITVPRIIPFSPLPTVTEAVTIDATTQPQPVTQQPIARVELDGIVAGPTTVGLFITAGNSRVQGLAVFRFGDSGIALTNHGGNVIQSNITGTSTAFAPDFGNGRNGIFLSNSADNIIGGTATAMVNLINSNHLPGIFIGSSFSTRNQVLGNLIAPAAPDFGIFLLDAPGNIIGGTTAGARNILLGNEGGIEIIGSLSSGNLLQGNFIGIDPTSTVNAGNAGCGGVFLKSPNNIIGGTTTAARNTISNNSPHGIQIIDSAATGNLIQGNFIGTGLLGATAFGNQGNGVLITNALNNTIGGAIPGARNIISANTKNGISIGLRGCVNVFGQKGAIVQGNFIGTDVGGSIPLGNSGDGVFVDNNSITNMIGGPELGAGNLIAFNQGDGIHIPNDPSTPDIPRSPAVQIGILTNLIHSNGLFGIDIGPPGITSNPGNRQSGANNLQNFPDVSSANFRTIGAADLKPLVTTSMEIKGSLNASPRTTYLIQFFFGLNCSAGQGHQFAGAIPVVLGSTVVTTDANGIANYDVNLAIPRTISTGGYVNATATDLIGNTSEMSSCQQVTGTPPPPGPTITNVVKDGKSFVITGTSFAAGAKVMVNGVDKKTRVDSATSIFSKKGAKAAALPATIQVRAADGSLSNEYIFNP